MGVLSDFEETQGELPGNSAGKGFKGGFRDGNGPKLAYKWHRPSKLGAEGVFLTLVADTNHESF
jgi:hypothetical protein